MMSEILTYPKKMPQDYGKAPLYRVSRYKTYSPKIVEAKAEFDARVKQYKEILKISGKSEDFGTKVVIKDGSKVLEIYRPSDSFWWTDLEVAYREEPKGEKLPSDEEAREIALRYIKERNLETKYARFVSIARTTVAVSQAEKKEPQELLDTEVHANFSFSIDDYPVMGPGAKIKISMVEEGRIGNFLWFWREPYKEKDVEIISPDEALTRLTRDRRFSHLSPDDVRISIANMKFGYYALPPFDFQRFLLPIYEIRGTEETKRLGKRDITMYAPAMELPPETIKKMGFVDQPDITRILASTK